MERKKTPTPLKLCSYIMTHYYRTNNIVLIHYLGMVH